MEQKRRNDPLIVDYVMNNPKWRVSLQTHKYLNIPYLKPQTTNGV
jgi:organic radical activating enzyme